MSSLRSLVATLTVLSGLRRSLLGGDGEDEVRRAPWRNLRLRVREGGPNLWSINVRAEKAPRAGFFESDTGFVSGFDNPAAED